MPRLISPRLESQLLVSLRWVVSIIFFFLSITKALLIIKHGNNPYLVLVQLAGLPEIFKYYGVVAIALEFFLAVAVWNDRFFRMALSLMIGLSSLGVCLSIYSLFYKTISECGCGLLGDNEYGLLAQKLIIIITLSILYKKKDILFPMKTIEVH